MAFHFPNETAGGVTVLWREHPPFYAGLCRPPMRIVVLDTAPGKAWQQGTNIGFDREFLAGLSWDDAAFILAHELWHYMLGHSELIYGWIKTRSVTGKWHGEWHVVPYEETHAQHTLDKVINDGLRTKAYMAVPKDAIIEQVPGDWMLGEATVYVRDWLDKEQQQKQQRAHEQQISDNMKQAKQQAGQGNTPSTNPAEPTTETSTQGKYYPTNSLVSSSGLVGACHPVDPQTVDQIEKQDIIKKFVEELTEKGQGGMVGMIDRLADKIEKQPEDWRKIVRPRVVNSLGRDRQVWSRLNKRALCVKQILPGWEGRRAGTIFLPMDTSGSIGGLEQRIYLGAFVDMFTEVTPRRCIVAEIDTYVRRTTEFTSMAHMRAWVDQHAATNMGLLGGGGTDMRAADQWLRAHNIRPDITIFFTDGHTPFPAGLGNSKRVVWVMTTGVVAPTHAGETVRFTRTN